MSRCFSVRLLTPLVLLSLLFFVGSSFAVDGLKQSLSASDFIRLTSEIHDADCEIDTLDELRYLLHIGESAVIEYKLYECRASLNNNPISKSIKKNSYSKIVNIYPAVYVKSIDITPPELQGIEFSANNVDVTSGEQTITVKVSVYEAESAPDDVAVYLEPPTGIPSSQRKAIYFRPSTGAGWKATGTADTYSHEITVKFDNSDSAGVWSARVAWIRDTNDNIAYNVVSASQIVVLGYDPYIDVTNSNTIDITPPELIGIEFSANNVDVTSGEQMITVKVSVYEAESVPDDVAVYLEPPTGIPSSQRKAIYFRPSTGAGWKATGTAGTYSHEITIKFDNSDSAGVWSARVAWIRDTNDNIAYNAVSASQIVVLGYDPYIDVTNSNTIDITPPELRGIEFSANNVDVTSGEQMITVKVSVYEAESAPDDVAVYLEPPTGIPSSQRKAIYFRPSTGAGWIATGTAGTYCHEITVKFDNSDSAGVWSARVAWVRDTNDNIAYNAVSASQIAALGYDPYIRVNISDEEVSDLILSGEDNSIANLQTGGSSTFQLSHQNFDSAPTNITFEFSLSENLQYKALSITGVTSQVQRCSITNQDGICDLTLSNDWVNLMLIVEYDVSKNEQQSITAAASSNGIELNHINNSATNYIDIDDDSDGDGIEDSLDALPFDASESVDTDGDLIGNNADMDDDDDGVLDFVDAFLLDATEYLDTDKDLIGNNTDLDDDNDGISDVLELAVGLDPLNAADALLDLDNDGVSNITEIQQGTAVDNADSDGDDIIDGDELANGSNPLDANSFVGERLSTIAFDDADNDSVADWLGYEIKDAQVAFTLTSGTDYTSLLGFSVEHSFETANLHLLADRNNDEVRELGVFGFDTSANRYQLSVHDGITGQKLATWNWPATLEAATFQVLNDLTGDGIQEYAITGVHLVNGTRQLVVKDGDTRASYKTFKWPDLWDDTRIVMMSDRTGDGIPEVALYGRHTRLDKGQLFVYDGATAKKVDVYNWNKLWNNIQLIKMDDVDSDGTIDWGQFGQRKDDDRYQWIVKKGHEKRGVIRTFSWPGDLDNAQPILVADRTGDGVREVALMGKHRNNGKVFLRINDGRLPNTRIANVSWPANWEDVQVQELGDLNNDGFNEYALLGYLATNRKVQLVVNDGNTLTEYGRYTFGNGYEDLTLSSYDSNDDGIIDVILSGINQASGEREYRTLNGRNLEPPVVIDSVYIVSEKSVLYKGRTIQIDAQANLVDGSNALLTNAGAWSVDQSSIASISNVNGFNGLFTAIDAGSTKVTFIPDGAPELPVDYSITVKAISEMANQVSKSLSASISAINGVVQNGSKITMSIMNNTGENLDLIMFQADDNNGRKVESTDSSLLSDGELTAGESIGLTYTVNFLGATLPITLTYTLRDPITNETFTVSSMYN